MARNGSGVFILPSNTWNPAVPGVAILSDDWNEIASNLVNGLTTSLASDGQTTATNPIPFAQGARFSAGSLSTPSMAQIGDLDTGFYFPGPNEIAAVCGGIAVWEATTTGVTFNVAVIYTDVTATGNLVVNGNTTLGNASGDTLTVNATGTFAGNQTFNGTATFTGTVTVPDASFTNAKLANMATQTIKGRTTAGSGAPEDLTATQATAILDPFTGDSGSGGVKGLVPAPASGDAAAGKVLTAAGSWGYDVDCKGTFNGTTGATLGTARNITCTRNGTGDYTFTIPTQANAFYTILICVQPSSSWIKWKVDGTPTTTSFNVMTALDEPLGINTDPAVIYVAVVS